MRFGSVCSGIEAASVAWEPLGWRAAFFSEIEPFPSEVLAHRFPAVPNRGDMTRYEEWPDADLDVLVGGTPCQAFSVAGLRAGLSDPRGNLMLTFAAIARKYRPRWLVWENVPGVFSSDGGRDFASLLAVLSGRRVIAPAGGWQNSGIVPGIEGAYGLAWRVLDAQFFGVAQRRRRVFVVGCLGDWRGAAAVLLELSSLRGDPPPSRGARKGAAAGARDGAEDGGVAGALTTRTRGGTADDLSDGHLIRNDVTAATLDAEHPASGQRAASEGALVFEDVGHTLRGEGHDASDDGTRQTIVGTLTGDGSKMGRPDLDAGRVIAVNAAGGGARENVAPTLPGDHLDRPSDTTPLVFEPRVARNGRGAPAEVAPPLKAENGSSGKGDGAPITFYEVSGACHTMMEHHGRFTGDGNETRLVGFSRTDDGRDALDDMAPTLRAMGHDASHPNGGGQAAVQRGLQVRRLTPLECERLQGFPDLWTLIPRKGGEAADGPRYKAIGNSMAVPVMRWIGQRIQEVDDIMIGGAEREHFGDADLKTGIYAPRDERAYVLRTHNLHDEEKGDVWLADVPGALNAVGAMPNQFDAVVYEADELRVFNRGGAAVLAPSEPGREEAEPKGTDDVVAAPPAPGRCAKRHVTCTIITHDKRTVVGTNECANPQAVCPRAPGEDYTKCRTVCRQRGHAELVALEMAREAGLDLKDAVAVLAGHYYICEPCWRAFRDAGFARVQLCL